jgi:hypothetical protein
VVDFSHQFGMVAGGSGKEKSKLNTNKLIDNRFVNLLLCLPEWRGQMLKHSRN